MGVVIDEVVIVISVLYIKEIGILVDMDTDKCRCKHRCMYSYTGKYKCKHSRIALCAT